MILLQPMKAKSMIIFILVVASVIGSTAIGFEAGQDNPDTKNLFTHIKETNS